MLKSFHSPRKSFNDVQHSTQHFLTTKITKVTKDLDRIFLLNFAFFACFAVKSVVQCRTAPRLGSLSSILGGCVAALRLWTGEENSRYIFPHLAALGGREQRAVAAFSSASFHDLDQ
jgi:hypothetical protein